MQEQQLELLIGLYVDGELNDAQRDKVDALLKSDENARRILKEIRSLQACLRALPRHQLQEDMTEGVLRSAEREMLSEPAQPLAGKAADSRKRRDEELPLWKRLARPRNLAYPAIVVAAAIVISLFAPPEGQPLKQDGQIAMHTESDQQQDGAADNQGQGEDRPLDADAMKAPGGMDAANGNGGVSLHPSAMGYSEQRNGDQGGDGEADIQLTVHGKIASSAFQAHAVTHILMAQKIGNYSRISGPGPNEVTFSCRITPEQASGLFESLGEKLEELDIPEEAKQFAEAETVDTADPGEEAPMADVNLILEIQKSGE